MTSAPDQASTHRIQEQQQQQQQRRRGSGQRTTTRQWQRQREPDAVMVKHDPCLLFLPPLRLLQLLLRRPLSPSFSFSFSSPQSRLVFLLLSYWPHLCFSLFLLLLNATVLAPNPGGGEGGGGALSRKGAAFRSCSWDLLRRNGRKFLLSPQFEWRFPRWVGSPLLLAWLVLGGNGRLVSGADPFLPGFSMWGFLELPSAGSAASSFPSLALRNPVRRR